MLFESISKQMEVDAAEKRSLIAESEKQKKILESDKKVSTMETARALEAQRRTEAESETQKQKFIMNSIAGGSGLLVVFAIFGFVFYKRKRDAEQKQKETKLHLNVSEMEMKALRSQMNPHFVFNALQSIQTFLIRNKSEDANHYLLKFSKLMRAVLENSLHSEVPLKDDMQALELYMQLESIRLKYPFTYAIHIAEDIDPETDTLPPLILQPFVENAIWHGLQYKSGPGHITIHISREHNVLKAVVEDNGIGRSIHNRVVPDVLLKKESLGMKLTEERLKVLNEVKKTNARFKIIDLFTSENQPSGTKVELSLPLMA
jgi:LytS/YehU family sensor histidine kinase